MSTFLFLCLLLPAVLWLVSNHTLGKLWLRAWLLGLLFLCGDRAAEATSPITSVTGSLVGTSQWAASQTQTGGSSIQSPIQSNSSTFSRALFSQTGTGANSINQVAVKVYSIGSSSSTTIDMSAAIRNVVSVFVIIPTGWTKSLAAGALPRNWVLVPA